MTIKHYVSLRPEDAPEGDHPLDGIMVEEKTAVAAAKLLNMGKTIPEDRQSMMATAGARMYELLAPFNNGERMFIVAFFANELLKASSNEMKSRAITAIAMLALGFPDDDDAADGGGDGPTA